MTSIRRSRLRGLLACSSIGLNALCAGGIFTFPLMSPVLASQLKLTQPQLTTVVLAGMMSQYTVASLVGKVIDIHGPSMCSFITAMLFSFAFGAFAAETYVTPSNPSSCFYRLTFCFFWAGLGTVSGYFSSLFAASRLFPEHTGIASGTSMALFGLSPLFLSVIASKWFTDPLNQTLNVSRFMTFMAILTTCVYLFGAINLRESPNISDFRIDSSACDTEHEPIDETTSLLPLKATDDTPGDSIAQLVRKSDFWFLAIFCVFTLGASEMVISNIGTIVASLPPHSVEHLGDTSPNLSTARQVKLLSISNTITRVLIGLLADFVSPVGSYVSPGVQLLLRKRYITRIAFLSGSAMMLALTFLWMKYQVTTRDDIWVLSVGTGIGYSVVFTVLPSVVSSMWGMKNLGRNFGVMMYAPFVGNPLLSYLYAFVSEAHSRGESVCQGRSCWQFTFQFCAGTSLLSLCVSLILWRRWTKDL